MIGFFKKFFSSDNKSESISIDEKTLALMGLEISCFMNWYVEKYNKMFSKEQVEMIARQFLNDKHEKLDFNSFDVKALTVISLTTDSKTTDKLRKDTGWDSKIDKFFKYHNIEIDENDDLKILDK